MATKVQDMTTGEPAKLLVRFALPLMLGNVFQQLYTITDAAIVGQFAGVDALAALGSADWLCWLVFGVVGGFMQGFSILVSQRFGEGDMVKLRKSVSTIVILSVVIAAIFTALGFALVGPLLRMMGTLDRVYQQAANYLYILYGGIFLTTMYNLLAGILRALGNGRVPLIAMVVASVVNIGLDLLFVITFQWDVAGAAAATVIAQGIAGILCLVAVLKLDILHYQKGEFCFEKADSRQLMKLSYPIAFQNAMISVGGMALQAVINSLGFIYVAGFMATNKLYGVMEAAAVSFGYAISTYTGQNLGAKKLDRIKLGIKKSEVIGFLTSVAITLFVFLIGKYCLMLFISASAEEGVMQVALRYLYTMAATLSFLYFLYVYRSALQGMGDTVMPMVSGFVECVMRVGTAWLLTRLIGPSGIFYAETAAWAGAAVFLAFSYFRRIAKMDIE